MRPLKILTCPVINSRGNKEVNMNIDRLIFIIANAFILITLLLSAFHSHYWLWLTALISANMLQAAFTGFCPMAKLLKKIGIKSGNAF